MIKSDLARGPLATSRLYLKPLEPSAAAAIHEAVIDSYDRLIPWRIWVADLRENLTVEHYAQFARRKVRQCKEGKAISLLIYERHTDKLVGGVSLNTIAPDRSHGYLEVWLRTGFLGRGYAHEAASCMMDLAFHRLGHDYMNAAHKIGNPQSRKTLLRLGFRPVHGEKSDWAHYTIAAPQTHV